jgi:hypothetical protein
MSYSSARAAFNENTRLVGPDPMADHKTWNLNKGLAELSSGVESDLGQIKELLTKILRELQKLQ